MKKGMLIILALIAGVFAQGSRESDSLALVAIRDANPGSSLKTAWDGTKTLNEWSYITLKENRVVSIRYTNDIGFKVLPPEIGNLSGLETLEISGDTTLFLSKELGSLSSLKKLAIDAYNYRKTILIDEFPEELENLSNLESLTIKNTAITEFPTPFLSMTGLTSLSLAYNSLTSLPPEIGNNTNLVYLNVNSNSIAVIPETITNLESLTIVDLKNNRFGFDILEKYYRDSTDVYPYQSNLRLDTTQLPLLIALVGGEYTQYSWYKNDRLLTNETSDTIDLSNYSDGANGFYCKATNSLFPVVLPTVTHVKWDNKSSGSLFVDSINLALVLDSIKNSSSNHKTAALLDEWNCFEREVSSNYSRIEWLKLTVNPDGHIIPEIGQLNALHTLIINDYSSNEWPDELYNLPVLNALTFVGNSRIPSRINSIPKLSSLTLNNVDKNRDFAILDTLKNITKLSFEHMSYFNTIPMILKKMTQLKELRFRDYTYVREYPPIFSSMSHLEKIYFNSRMTSFLPDDITLTRPTYVDLSGNRLSEDYLTDAQVQWLDKYDLDWRETQGTTQFNNDDSTALALLMHLNPEATLGWDTTVSYTSWEGVVIDPILNRVTELHLSGKNLSALSSSICLMDKLMLLDISNNNLESIPAIIYKNTLLRKINASNNKLTLLFTDIAKSAPSIEFDVSNNTLNELYLETVTIEWLDKYDPDWRATQGQTEVLNTKAMHKKAFTAQFTGRAIQFSLPLSKSTKVSLFDFNGREIFSSSVQGHLMAIPPLAKGIYLMKVRGGEFQRSLKISIK